MEQMYFITHLLFHWFLFVPWIAAAVIVVRAADMGLTRVILETTGDGDWKKIEPLRGTVNVHCH